MEANKYECAWERNTINSCWGAAPQIEHRIAGWEKTTKLSNFWQFFEQFSHKTSNLYINNTYFAKKIGSYTLSWPVGGLKHFGQSQGVFPPPTQLTNTKNTMCNTSQLSRAIYYTQTKGWQFAKMLKMRQDCQHRQGRIFRFETVNWIIWSETTNVICEFLFISPLSNKGLLKG